MDPGLGRDVLTVVAGFLTGVVSACFGVGGATVSTPAVRALGASPALAIGTTLPSILPGAAVGSVRYARGGLIRWRVVAWTVPVGMAAAVGASFASRAVPGHGHWLMLLTAGLVAFTAWRIGRAAHRARRPAPDVAEAAPVRGREEAAETLAPVAEVAGGGHGRGATGGGHADVPAPAAGTRGAGDTASTWLMALVGTGAGVLSGLLGVGGGIVMVPGFSQLLRLDMKETIATSLVCVGLLAVPSTITHAFLGDIDWRMALLLTVGVLPGARVGARIAIRAQDDRLQVAVALFLTAVAVIYAAGEVRSMLA